MGFLGPALSFRPEQRASYNVSSSAAPWGSLFGGSAVTPSGKSVSEDPESSDSALRLGAVFACVRVLSETLPTLPLALREKRKIGDRVGSYQIVGGDSNPIERLATVLHDQPNEEQTKFEFINALMLNLCLAGNGFFEIQYDNGGNIIALWPLPWWTVEIERRPDKWRGKLWYLITLPDGERRTLPFYRVGHIKAFGNGRWGYSPIAYARQTVGLGLATEEYGARFFGAGAKPGGFLEHPAVLTEQGAKKLRKSFEAAYQGLTNAHRLMVLEEGMKYNPISLPPEDAQFLETQKFTVNQIARLFRVPPHLIQDLERATFNNIEELGIGFVRYTMLPWVVLWEQALKRDIIPPEVRVNYEIKFNLNGLLRGDSESRHEIYSKGFNNGFYNHNDIQILEDRNPLDPEEHPWAETYFVPLNLVPADQALQMAKPPDQNEQARRSVERRGFRQVAAERHKLALENRPRFLAAAEDAVDLEVEAVRDAARIHLSENDDLDQLLRIDGLSRDGLTADGLSRDESSFSAWLATFYEDYPEEVALVFAPLLLAYAGQIAETVAEELGQAEVEVDERFVDDYLTAFASGWATSSLLQLRALLADEAIEPEEAIRTRLDEWAAKKANKVAEEQRVRAMGANVVQTYEAQGVQRLRWVTFGENCPYCADLDGKIISIRDVFLGSGQDYQPSGADKPLRRRSNIKHPPLHGGCDCQVVAA